MSSTEAIRLKQEGNTAFGAGDYVEAEKKYSKAIIADSTNPMLYTNRANARLKLHHYEAVIPDCRASLELLESNMKAYYFMAQAELELGRKAAALETAELAYDLCSGVKVGSRRGTQRIAGYDPKWASSLTSVAALVLRCKKEVWEMKERKRLREVNPLLEDLVDVLQYQKLDDLTNLELENLGDIERQEMANEIEESCASKIDLLRRTWAKGAEPESKTREVPDWAIDDITFAIMHDPVVTKTGHSYERAAIEEHLRRSPTDPLTREPLHRDELRPNLGLRHACADFLAENGWAVDW